MSEHAERGSRHGTLLVTGAIIALLAPALAVPTAVADVTIGVCVWEVGEARIPLRGFPPGHAFVGVYAGPGTRGVYLSEGGFHSACNRAVPVLL